MSHLKQRKLSKIKGLKSEIIEFGKTMKRHLDGTLDSHRI